MKKFLPAVAFTLTIIVFLSVFFLSMRNNATKCDIGIFYYVWYDIKDPNSWNPQKIVDSPILGYYDSGDEAVIKEHLVWFDGLSIDLIIFSWWGFEYIDIYAAFIENAAHQVFRTTIEQGSDLRICLMVEPFLERDLPEGELATYDYTEIYDYISARYPAVFRISTALCSIL